MFYEEFEISGKTEHILRPILLRASYMNTDAATKKASIDIHSHPFYEFYFVKSGTCDFFINSTTYRVTKGDVIIVKPDKEHCEKPQDNVHVELVSLGIDGVRIPLNGDKFIQNLNSDFDFIDFCFSNIIEEIRNRTNYSKLSAQNLAEVLFFRLLKKMDADKNNITSTASGSPIEHIIQYVDTHFNENLEIKQLAEMSHTCKEHFIRIFKQHTGLPPLQYIVKKRLEHTKTALLYTNKSMVSISIDAGFSDVNYYIKKFKAEYGETPGSYRSKNQRKHILSHYFNSPFSSEKGKAFLRVGSDASESYYIDNIGYNDFQFIIPWRFERTQSLYTVHIVLSGGGIFNLSGQSYNLSEGDIFFCPPGVPFSYYPNENDPWEYVWFALYGKGISEILSDCGLSLQTPVIKDKGKYVSDFIIKFIKINKSGLKNIYSAYALWYRVISALSATRQSNYFEEQTDKFYADRAEECINSNFSNPDFKAEYVSVMIYVSHTYLSKIFKEYKYTTLNGLLTDLRLRKATELLSNTNMSVQSIAKESGFQNATALSKALLKQTNKTPSAFRTV